MFTRRAGFLCLLLSLVGCARTDETAAPVRLFAAVSTQAALNEIKDDFAAATGVRVEPSFAASSTLARQIEHGADADLFLSADEEWADYLDGKGLAVQRRPLLTNRLVVVVPADSTLTLKEVADVAGPAVRRLAVAGEAVPAGRYACKALLKAGVWEHVEGRVLEGKDVAATLLYVARGEADAGFVYATDAAAAGGKVRVACEVPESLTGPIRYPLVTVRRGRPNPDAARFVDYLAGDAAGDVFRKAGFGLAR